MFFPTITSTGAFTSEIRDAVNGALASSYPGQPSQLLAASVAINPNLNGFYLITKAGVGAFTLAAPTQNGIVITLMSTTANAHTLTATGLLQTGAAAVNLATFAAFAGAQVTVYSYNGLWFCLPQLGITFS